MLQGFSIPLSTTGHSSLAPQPPWHFAGNFLAIEYWADPDAVQALLPPGVDAGADPGRCAVFFSEMQYVTSAGNELHEPAVCQYHECLIALSATWEAKPASVCPYIFVDNDNSLMRGLIQGMPKQIGTIGMTRTYAIDSPASPPLGPGGTFAGTLSHRDRRLVDALVMLAEPTTDAPNRMLARMINMRHFASIAMEQGRRPAVHELVRQRTRDVKMSHTWRGEAKLSFHASPWHELHDLKPVRIGTGYRYTFAMTIDDVTVVRDLRAGGDA